MKPVILSLLLAVLVAGSAHGAGTNRLTEVSTIEYVPTRQDVVQDMLWLAKVGKEDVVYDLGSGDGRVLIAAVRDRGARKAVGVELDPELVVESRESVRKASLSDRVEIVYLGHNANLELRSKLVRTLKPGSRVVSHQFGMGEWKPDKHLKVRTQYLGMFGRIANMFESNPKVPDFDDSNPRDIATVSLWIVPAPIAGIWRGKLALAQGECELVLIVHQTLAGVTGVFEVSGATNYGGALRFDLWGDHLRFEGYSVQRSAFNNLMFDGHVLGNVLHGTLAVWGKSNVIEFKWHARREVADFTGSWEWLPVTNAPHRRLEIQRTNGSLEAVLVDRGVRLRMNDFYDFEGGFYFTHLIGREDRGRGSYSLMVGPESGWLIGEGVFRNGTIEGTTSFYPCMRGHGRGSDGKTNVTVAMWENEAWFPTRIKP
jgi:SAM-dependent methyltransferase